MIKPLQSSNLNFKGSSQDQTPVMSPLLKDRLSASSNADFVKFQAQASAQDARDKLSVENSENKIDTVENTKRKEKKEKIPFFNRVLNFGKKFNKGFKTTLGYTKGIAIAVPVTVASAALAKNLKENIQDGFKASSIFNMVGGAFIDAAQGADTAGNFFATLKDRKAAQNIGAVLKTIPQFYTKYLGKNNAAIAAGATILGAGIIAFNVIKARLHANRQNADIDHTFYTEHKV